MWKNSKPVMTILALYLVFSACRAVEEGAFDIDIQRAPEVYLNQLRPEYGVNFKYNGILSHSLERAWITLRVPMPDAKSLSSPWLFKNPYAVQCHRYNGLHHSNREGRYFRGVYTKLINRLDLDCQHCRRRLDQHRARFLAIHAEIERIAEKEFPAALPEMYEENTRQAPSRRRKRWAFLAPLAKVAIGGFIPIVSEWISSRIRKKRNKAVIKAMDVLRQRMHANSEGLIALREDMAIVGQKVMAHTKEVAQKMQEHKAEVEKKLYDHFREMADWRNEVNRQQDAMRYYVRMNLQLIGLFSDQARHCDLLMENIQHQLIVPAEKVLKAYEQTLRAIAVLGRGYLPETLVGPQLLQDIINRVNELVLVQRSGYVPALDSIHTYYDMKLVSFMVDPKDKFMIITFPVLLKPARMNSFKLYEIETVHVPITDQDHAANTYTRVVITKPYLASGENYYIQLRIPELRMCKLIGFKYFCEELFTLKHRTKQTCESALFYEDKGEEIAQTCEFQYFYNKTVIPSVLDGGDKIVLANMKESKRLNCYNSQNVDLPSNIPHSPYAVVSRSFLCDCHLTTEMVTLLSSPSACEGEKSRNKTLTFTLNPAFLQVLSQFKDNLENTQFDLNISDEAVEELRQTISSPIPQELPIVIPDIRSPDSLDRPDTLKELVDDTAALSEYLEDRKVMAMSAQQQMDRLEQENPPERLEWIDKWQVIFTNLLATIVTIFIVIIVIYLCRKQNRVKSLVYGYMGANLPVSKAFESLDELDTPIPTSEPEIVANTVVCHNVYMTYLMALISFIVVTIYIIRACRSRELCKGIKLKGTTTIFITLSSNERLVRIKIKEIQAHLGLFMIYGTLMTDQIQMVKQCAGGKLLIDWSGYKLIYDGKDVAMPPYLKLSFLQTVQLNDIFSTNTLSAYFEIKKGDGWWIPRHSLIQPDANLSTVPLHGSEGGARGNSYDDPVPREDLLLDSEFRY